MRSIAPPGGGFNAVPGEDVHPSPDLRIAAFVALIDAFDRRDWKDGQLATRRLRLLGLSVCLVTPPGGRGRG